VTESTFMMAVPWTNFDYDVQVAKFTSKERDAETGLDKCALRTNR
jgi:hypothetical protein